MNIKISRQDYKKKNYIVYNKNILPYIKLIKRCNVMLTIKISFKRCGHVLFPFSEFSRLNSFVYTCAF